MIKTVENISQIIFLKFDLILSLQENLPLIFLRHIAIVVLMAITKLLIKTESCN